MQVRLEIVTWSLFCCITQCSHILDLLLTNTRPGDTVSTNITTKSTSGSVASVATAASSTSAPVVGGATKPKPIEDEVTTDLDDALENTSTPTPKPLAPVPTAASSTIAPVVGRAANPELTEKKETATNVKDALKKTSTPMPGNYTSMNKALEAIKASALSNLKLPPDIKLHGKHHLCELLAPSTWVMNNVRTSIKRTETFIAEQIGNLNKNASYVVVMEVAESITREIVQEYAQESIFRPKRKEQLSEEEVNAYIKSKGVFIECAFNSCVSRYMNYYH